MKKLSIYLAISSIALAGCAKEEEPSAAVVEAETVEVVEDVAEAPPEAQTKNSLVASGDAIKQSLPDLEKQAKALTDSMTKETAAQTTKTVEKVTIVETTVTTESTSGDAVVTKEVDVVEVEAAAPESSGEGMLSKAMGAAGSVASQLDWQNLSWDKVSEVPFSDKTQLIGWAAQQAESWKGKLTTAAMEKGTGMLENLGDTGWQGSLKKVMDAINGVREASPETWDMAKGALVSAWGTFETQASKYLAK